jgi:hypothetical protein
MRTSAALLLLALTPALRGEDYQKLADDAKWDWKDDDASVYRSFDRAPADYHVELVKPQGRIGALRVRFSKDGKELLAFDANYATVFVVKGGVVYRADFHPSSSGCALAAFDLAAGKELWRTPLKGLGPIAHFQYHNQVTLALAGGDALRVLGNESAGRYVEYVDAKTGKTVGHKVFPKP